LIDYHYLTKKVMSQ